MKCKKWGAFLFFFLWLSTGAVVSNAQVLQVQELTLGVPKNLDFPKGIKRVAIADDSVANVSVERVSGAGNPAKLLLMPIKAGNTSLMVWGTGSDEPRSLLLNVAPSLHMRADKYEKLTEMALKETVLKSVTGSASAEVNASQVQHKSNVVQVEVKIVELNKNRLQQAGLNIFSTGANSQGFSFGLLSPGVASNPNFSGVGGQGGAPGGLQGIGASPFSQAFGLLMNFGKANIGLNLGMLEGSGMARVLAEPTLLAISGQSANFLAGGEVPIPVAQGNGAINIEYKSYGVGLTVSPTILDNQRIVLKVAPESSELDYANAVTLQSVAVPALTVRKADTTVELADGESFVIGGLVSQSTSSNINRVPFLSEIPILGMMFKRQEFSRKERELVIVVTPRLVKPIASNASLAEHMPGATQMQRTSGGFWSSYLGPSGGSDQFPGFSQ